jgi:ComF family protein
MFFKGLYYAFLASLFPPRCPACGNLRNVWMPEFGKPPFDTAALFCRSCSQGVTPIVSPFCPQCGIPFVSRKGDGHMCVDCLREKPFFRKARAYGIYERGLLEAIHQFKYGKKLSRARPLAALVRQTFFQFWNRDDIDLMVPVPLHKKRLRERAFNQAYLLIAKWAKRERISFDGMALWRRRWTCPQTGLNRKERFGNMNRAFAVRKPEIIRGKRILLVDDVYTTGATVNACARALMGAGAELVDVLTLARAVG